MDIQELKQTLIKIGVNQELVEMPAIMERILPRLVSCKTESEVREKISVNKKGKVTVAKDSNKTDSEEIEFGLEEKGAYLNYGSIEMVEINKFGMDTLYVRYDLDGGGYKIYTRIEGKRIVHYGEGRSSTGVSAYNISDSGSPLLFRPEGENLSWEENEQYYREYWPITAEFYDGLERTPEEARIEELEDKIEDLTKKINRCKLSNQRLEETNKNLQKIVGEKLEICNKIAQSKAGKIFLRKYVKQMENLNLGDSKTEKKVERLGENQEEQTEAMINRTDNEGNAEETDRIKELKRKIIELQKEYQELKNRNTELWNENDRLQTMLSETRKFLRAVKNSRANKLFKQEIEEIDGLR